MSISEKFYAGLYSDIVAEYVDSSAQKKTSSNDAVFITGALCFLARSSEADAVFDSYSANMTFLESMEARLYLVFAHRRLRKKLSRAHASKILLTMAIELRRDKSAGDLAKFFFFCGLAFFRYTDARLVLTQKWARRAYDHAFRAKFPFGRLLSYDLLGHSQLNVGDIRAGMKNLLNSASIAESLGRGAIVQATQATLRLYRSTFGLDTAANLEEELRGAIRACSFENSYTLATLYLEQSRLQILIGHGQLAEQSLRDAGEWIYKLDLPFLDANLSFRYAYLSVLQGDNQKALDLLRSARLRLLEANDASMEVRILGLEARVLNAQGKTLEAGRLTLDIQRLESRSGLLIAHRINGRLGVSAVTPLKRGEDFLGDLMDDLANQTTDIRERVLQSGFLGLIPKSVGVGQFSQAILFGFVGASVTILAKGFVRHDRDGWPELVRKLFLAMSAHKELTKEEITERVWQQGYNPLRHDPLIYALVARARKMIEPYDSWLTISDGKYSLVPEVQIHDVSQVNSASDFAMRISHDIISKNPNLPVRQSRLLDLCEKMGAITNKDVCEALKVSEVTAGRDLAALVALGLLRRLGKGRATSYTTLTNL